MKKLVFALLTGLLATTVMAQVTFTVASPAVNTKPEIGFDSKLVSAGRLDQAYTGNQSLPFTWSGLPAGTKAVAVVFDDPDARLVMKAFGMTGEFWLHWAVTDVDPSLGGLPADASAKLKLVQGMTSFGTPVYGGPAPPADVPANAPRPIVHIYRLQLFALSAPTGLKPGFSLDDLRKAMAGTLLGTAQLNISYSN